MASSDFARSRQDALVNPAAKALPAAASTTVYTASIDLGNAPPQIDPPELEIQAPALTTTMAPDTRTMTYAVQDSADDSSFTTIQSAVLVQTGAGGAGAAAATKRIALPSDCRRYVRVSITSGASITDSSAVTCQVVALF